MSGNLDIKVAPVFEPLLASARYKAAYGGRGSGKSQFFADLIVIKCLERPGVRVLCCREVQKSLKESAKRLIESKIEQYNLGSVFLVKASEIETPGGGLIAFAGLQDHTSESIKSGEGFDIAWVEEAQSVSHRSLNLLRPTIRKPQSELWFSWNPRYQVDAVDQMFRENEPPTGSIIVRANWDRNPWFPAELEQERQDCLRSQPEQYGHIWEGEYVSAIETAYYARQLAQAREEGRITTLERDELLPVRCYWDIGVSDSTVIWVTQRDGDRLKFIDYYEAEGQSLGAHLNWLRSKGYDTAEQVLPHDGAHRDKYTAIRYEDHIRNAGFSVRTVPNQGRGAEMKRVDRARVLFNRMWFDADRCNNGLKALGWYHEKKNAAGYGVGPEHDWASHAADAFGLAACDYEKPKARQNLDFTALAKGIV